MTALLDDRFSPTTRAIGLLARPLADVAADKRQLDAEYGHVWTFEEIAGPLPDLLRRLRPLRAQMVNELLVDCRGSWTAVFDDTLGGSDPWETLVVLAERLGCTALYVAFVPLEDQPHEGALHATAELTVLEPSGDEEAWPVRVVGGSFDGTSWTWREEGDPLAFEDLDGYAAPAVVDRLPLDLLRRYCRGLGVTPFDEDFYGDRAVLIRRIG